MRADARRNYDRLLEVAKESFAAHGPDASLDDIAKKAGVGSGTLYRHFPTRQSLQEAVYREEVDRLCAQADAFAETETPEVAFVSWSKIFVAHALSKRGLAMALKRVLDLESELFAYCHAEIRRSAGKVLEGAQAVGFVRPDLEVQDMLRLVSGVALACEHADRPLEESERLLAFVLDAMRTQTR